MPEGEALMIRWRNVLLLLAADPLLAQVLGHAVVDLDQRVQLRLADLAEAGGEVAAP